MTIEEALIIINEKPINGFETLSDDLKDNYQVVGEAFKNYPGNLQLASDRIKDDKEFLLPLIENWGIAFQYISDRLKNDADLIWAALKKQPNVIVFIDENIDDYDSYVAYVSSFIKIDQADDCLTSNFIYMKNKIINDGALISFASKDLKNNKELGLLAVSQNPVAFIYLSEELQAERELLLIACLNWDINLSFENFSHPLAYTSNNLKDDNEIVLKALEKYPWALEFASKRLLNDKSFILPILKNNGILIEYVSEGLKNDIDVVSIAVENNGMAYELLEDYELFDNEFVFSKAISAKYSPYMPSKTRCEEIKTKSPNIMNFKPFIEIWDSFK